VEAGRDMTYTAFSSAAGAGAGVVGVADSGESTTMLSISSVQTTISGAMSSEPFAESCLIALGTASGSDAVLAGGDGGLAGLASEVRGERRESISLAAPRRRPFPEPLDCLVRDFEEVPIISAETTDPWVGGGRDFGGNYLASAWSSSVLTGPARPRAM
jgi:hypothetical protein